MKVATRVKGIIEGSKVDVERYPGSQQPGDSTRALRLRGEIVERVRAPLGAKRATDLGDATRRGNWPSLRPDPLRFVGARVAELAGGSVENPGEPSSAAEYGGTFSRREKGKTGAACVNLPPELPIPIGLAARVGTSVRPRRFEAAFHGADGPQAVGTSRPLGSSAPAGQTNARKRSCKPAGHRDLPAISHPRTTTSCPANAIPNLWTGEAPQAASSVVYLLSSICASA